MSKGDDIHMHDQDPVTDRQAAEFHSVALCGSRRAHSSRLVQRTAINMPIFGVIGL